MKRLGAVLLAFAACTFAPDLSGYADCGPANTCAKGFECAVHANKCVPACGDEKCPGDEDAGADAAIDAGVDAGIDAGEDAGFDAGFDAGPGLFFLGGPLSPAVERTAYSHVFTAQGGDGGYRFYPDAGFPPGFALAPSGAMNGSSDAGDLSFGVTVVDAADASVSAQFSLHVRPDLEVAIGTLSEAIAGQSYSDRLCASGYEGSRAWSLSNKPAWLTLAGDGTLSGTAPASATTENFSATVSDTGGSKPLSRTRAVSLNVASSVLPGFKVRTQALCEGRQGEPYDQFMHAATGGTTPYHWTATGLPTGLSINDNGEVTGTPTAPGSYTVQFDVADSTTPLTNKANQSFQLIIH